MGALVDGKYQVVGIVGVGGMGKVYEAEHVALGRRVALKVLHAGFLARDDALARFHREARSASSIGHPNICEVYDVGYLPDLSPYMVMELLHGSTLADRLETEGSLPFNDVFDIITQVLSALVAAHAKGIIHRDIKPENVFLSERVGCPPMVKLLDFGIVKPQDDGLELTNAGTIMGTPFYMAPELIRGRPYDHRIDLYACGVMLYEMLTGVLPFDAPNYHALAEQILNEEPPDPTELRADLSVSWFPVLDKSLAKDPSLRYRQATDFLLGLEDLKAGLAIRRSLASLPIIQRDSGSSIVIEEPAPPSIDIPVVQSIRSEDLPLEPAPDTIYDPHAPSSSPADSSNLEPPRPEAWSESGLLEEPEAVSAEPITPLVEKWDERTGYEETRPAATAVAFHPPPTPALELMPESDAIPTPKKQVKAPTLDSRPPPTVRSSIYPEEPKRPKGT